MSSTIEQALKLVNEWGWEAVARAYFNQPTARSDYRAAGVQQYLDGHVCRGWDLLSELHMRLWLDSAVRAGYTGLDIELCGHAPSFYGINSGGSYYAAAGGVLRYHVVQARGQKLKTLLAECRKRRLWLLIRDFNTNDKALVNLTQLQDFVAVHSALVDTHGIAGILRQPMNETDANTNPQIRERYEDIVAGTVPRGHMVSSFESEIWSPYVDHHPSSVVKASGYGRGFQIWVSSDNGSCIAEMTAGPWQSGTSPAYPTKHMELVRRALDNGNSGSNYSWHRVPQRKVHEAIGQVLRGKL